MKKILLVMIISAISILIIAVLASNFYKRRGSVRNKFINYLPETYEFIYDESHCNTWSLRDTGYEGFSECALILREHGIEVSVNNIPLDDVIKSIPDKIIPFTIIFLNIAKFQRYGKSEIDAVTDFVKGGGRLFVLTEHDNTFETADFQNPMVAPFGMTINADHIDDWVPPDTTKNGIYGFNSIGSSSYFSLGKVHHLISASLTCSGECVVLLEGKLRGKDYPIGYAKKFGRGRIILLGDTEIWWNGDGNIGIDQADNRQFFIRCIEWLIEKKLVKKNPEDIILLPESQVKKTIFIDISSQGLGVNNTISGLGAFAAFLGERGYKVVSGTSCKNYDIRVIASPLKKVSLRGRGDERIILFSEHFFDLQPFAFWGDILLKKGARNRINPYSEIEKEYSIAFLPCILTDGEPDSFYSVYAKLLDKKFRLHRAGALQLSGSKNRNFKLISIHDEDVWGEYIHPGLESENNGIPQRNKEDISDPVVMANNDRIFICADGDIVSNQNIDQSYAKYFMDFLIQWIEGNTTQ